MRKALISIRDAAHLLGVSEATGYRMAKAQQLPIIRLGDDGAMRVIRSKLVEQYGIAEPDAVA